MSFWKVTKQKVLDIQPIEGADSIEVATILGWKCVIKKGDDLAIGDYGIYFPIDSVMPKDDQRYEFLAQRRFRVRTIKLKGQLSQGLFLSLSYFTNEELQKIEDKIKTEGEDADLSEILNIVNYETIKPAERGMRNAGFRNFPTFIQKTDEERIQNIPWVIDLFKTNTFEVTEKLDGMSLTMYFNNDEFGITSRNCGIAKNEDCKVMEEQIPVWQYAIENDVENKLKKFGRNLALQGEFVGPGIQKNKYGLTERDWYIYKIWDIDKQIYLLPNEVREIVIHTFDLKYVPFELSHFPTEMLNFICESRENTAAKNFTLDDLLKFADGNSRVGNKSIREGIVFKSNEYIHKNLLSFKVINNKFLLKYDKED